MKKEAVAVCYGSFKDGLETAGFVMEASQGIEEVIGQLVTPGEPRVQVHTEE